MKAIALGDIHGRGNWKQIVTAEKPDLTIFIGDYWDSFDIPFLKQMDNFRDIIAFKKANPNEVKLLFGNHDFHYVSAAQEKYSGYQKFHAMDISDALHKALEENLMQMCFQYNGLLFSHAGVTKTWCKENGIKKFIPQAINDIFKFQPTKFRFARGENDSDYGDDICQPPIWVRPESLLKDGIDGYMQIVGHTQQDKMILSEKFAFIDTLGTSGEYFIINGTKISAKKL